MTGPTAVDEMEHPDHPELASAAAYALDALDGAERRAFEAHLASCARCRAEVAELRDVTASLAHAAPAASPPPMLRDRVLREAREGRASTVAQTPVVPLAPRRARTSALPWLAAAAGLVLAAGLGWSLAQERAERRALQGELARAESRADDALRLAAQRDSLLNVVLSPAASSAKLAATGQPPSMQLVWHRGAGIIVISASNLAPARPGRTYQLWGLDAAGRPLSLGTFDTRGDGRGYVILRAPGDMGAVRVSAVTEEPAGGSPGPTTQPFLVGRWG